MWAIDMVFVVGGNGGNAGAAAIQAECAKSGVTCSVIGIPKSIDNDILLVLSVPSTMLATCSDHILWPLRETCACLLSFCDSSKGHKHCAVLSMRLRSANWSVIIVQIDKCFGFDTAVEESQRALMAAKVEATSAYKGIGLVKLMGRQSGFIAMQASMASGMWLPTLCPNGALLNSEQTFHSIQSAEAPAGR